MNENETGIGLQAVKIKLCSKIIKNKAVFTETETINDWNGSILQNCFLCIQHTYSSKFSNDQNISEIPFSFDVVWSYNIVLLLMPSMSSNLTVKINFQFRKQEKVAGS